MKTQEEKEEYYKSGEGFKQRMKAIRHISKYTTPEVRRLLGVTDEEWIKARPDIITTGINGGNS